MSMSRQRSFPSAPRQPSGGGNRSEQGGTKRPRVSRPYLSSPDIERLKKENFCFDEYRGGCRRGNNCSKKHNVDDFKPSSNSL